MTDAKPRARYVATSEEWFVLRDVVHRLQNGLCGCGCGRRIESVHHLVSRPKGGDDVISCLIGLYGDGTRGCHGALTSGNRVNDASGWINPEDVRTGIRWNLRLDQIAYIYERVGDWYLEKHYPKGV